MFAFLVMLERIGPMTFAEKSLMVFRAMGYSDADIEEVKQVIREAWADMELRQKWVNWINKQAEVWR